MDDWIDDLVDTLAFEYGESRELSDAIEFAIRAAEREDEEFLKLGMDTLVNYMDDELREQVHRELAPCTDKEFLVRYMELHREKFDEEFDVN